MLVPGATFIKCGSETLKSLMLLNTTNIVHCTIWDRIIVLIKTKKAGGSVNQISFNCSGNSN